MYKNKSTHQIKIMNIELLPNVLTQKYSPFRGPGGSQFSTKFVLRNNIYEL